MTDIIIDDGYAEGGGGEGDPINLDASCIQPESLSGCPDPAKTRTVVIEGQALSSFCWPLIDPQTGDLIDPEVEDSFVPLDGYDYSLDDQRVALFYDPFQSCKSVQKGRISYSPDRSLIIEPPVSILNTPSIYLFEMRWTQPDNKVINQRGLFSVEPSLFSRLDPMAQYAGPLTLREVRTRLRDFPSANALSEQFEWSAEEILEAIVRPIMHWNDTPPVISRYSPANFPYRSYWLDATVSTLYTTAAHSMLRNDIPLQAEGVTSSERNAGKWQFMFQYAEKGWADYKAFVHRQKGHENMRNGWRIM